MKNKKGNKFANLNVDEDINEEIPDEDPIDLIISGNKDLGFFKTVNDLESLAKGIEQYFGLKSDKKKNFCESFDSYEKVLEEYGKHVQNRLKCFDFKTGNDFIECLDICIGKIKLNGMVEMIRRMFESLSQKSPYGHGSLFLVSYILSKNQNCFHLSDFEVAIDLYPKYGSIICWVFGYMIMKNPNSIRGDQLLDFFLPILLMKDVKFSPTAVCAAYLISFLYEKQRFAISSFAFCKLHVLLVRRSMERDVFVNRVLEPVLGSNINDLYDFVRSASSLSEIPSSVNKYIVEEAKKGGQLLNGWLSFHKDYPVESNRILSTLKNGLPQEIIALFLNDCANVHDDADLTKIQKDLFGRSARFLVISIVGGVFYYLQKEFQII